MPRDRLFDKGQAGGARPSVAPCADDSPSTLARQTGALCVLVAAIPSGRTYGVDGSAQLSSPQKLAIYAQGRTRAFLP